MKTKLLYHQNSFTYECTAKVVAVENDEIALDATVFYPRRWGSDGGSRRHFLGRPTSKCCRNEQAR